MSRDTYGQGENYDRTVLRFGLQRYSHGSAVFYDTNIWQRPNSPIRVVLQAQHDPMELTLEDLGDDVKKPENP